jgi:hypothetical protein
MAYEFTNNEFELEPAPSSSRGGFPPRKNTAAGVLDPPFPPKHPPEPIPATPSRLGFLIVMGVLFVGVTLAAILLGFARH